MKKNKTVAYALAATLLVGGTFLGTKALFTDKVDVAGELKISTGDVDIDVIEDTSWKLIRLGNDSNTGTNNDSGDKLNFDNLKTGDKIERTVKVKNDGTLKAQLELGVTENFELPHNGTLLSYDIKLDEGTTKVLNPKDEAQVKMVIEVIGEGQHNQSGSWNNDTQEAEAINLTGAWTLKAKQVNGNAQEEVTNQPIKPVN